MVDNVFSREAESPQFLAKTASRPYRNFLDGYINFQIGGQFDFEIWPRATNSEAKKGIFTFQKVGFEGLHESSGTSRTQGEKIEGDRFADAREDVQSPVPVL